MLYSKFGCFHNGLQTTSSEFVCECAKKNHGQTVDGLFHPAADGGPMDLGSFGHHLGDAAARPQDGTRCQGVDAKWFWPK